MPIDVIPLKAFVNLDSVINMPSYLSAQAAALKLDVSRSTLYAYVSRGLIRSRAIKGQRQRRYFASDIERLVREKSGRRDPAGVARQSLSVEGLPVLSSRLTLIDAGQLYYRGRDAVALSKDLRFEQVAALLWEGALTPALVEASARERAELGELPFASAAQARLATAGSADAGATDLSPEGVRKSGSRIVWELTALAARTHRIKSASVAQSLAAAWRVPNARAALDAALILCADHELNVSAFTARVIASARANPYMAVSGAVGALSGLRHGGTTGRVAHMLEAQEGTEGWVVERLRRGEVVDGFGHPLYPEGDPRAARLLEACPDSPLTERGSRFARVVEQHTGLRPNIDFALVVLCQAFGLPAPAPLMLFAVGRSVGWVAHCLEQYASDELIRPRARYIGVAPIDPRL